MDISELTAISPIDGRYRRKIEKLDEYYSEYSLIRFRIQVEVEYFIALCEMPLPQLKDFDSKAYGDLKNLYLKFSAKDALRVKEIEKTTNHDVKAVEYLIKEFLDKKGLSAYREFVHFGLTSQDINNTAVPYAVSNSLSDYVKPMISALVAELEEMANKWDDIPMLAFTHGQPASPTTLGKEIQVFAERLNLQLKALNEIKFSCKFGGATGNLNAHKVTYPNINWINFANNFTMNSLGLVRQQTTTQIEHYDDLAAVFDALARINTILTDLSKDFWTYISMGYFKQQIKAGEVGSSAMPHKVNPIDFENAEGNLGMANAVFKHLSAKLPVSRLQRDLTDSTVLRNIGVPMAHSCIAYQAIKTGLGKLLVNKEKISLDLENNWAVVAEAIQSILRREGVADPYEKLKELTRTNAVIGKMEIHHFIDGLEISDAVKKELKNISPMNYTGYNLYSRRG